MMDKGSEPRGSDGLRNHILALINLVAIRGHAASAPLRRDLGIGTMDFRCMSVLAAEPGVSGVRIAEVIGRDEAAVSRSLKSLMKRGLVTEIPASGRARRLELTAQGVDIQQRGWAVARENERQLVSVLSADEQQALLSMLQRLLDNSPPGGPEN